MIQHTIPNRRGTFYSLALLCLMAFPALGADLKLTQTKDIIRVTLGNKPVLEYVKTEKPVPEGVAPVYRRSGYIHPVFSPSGQEVTGDFPADHAPVGGSGSSLPVRFEPVPEPVSHLASPR